jgi:tetratricopeptide (TPR) repeat protein
MSHGSRATPEGLKIALQYYNLALEIDPSNALAHAGIGGVWAIRHHLGITPRQEAMPLWKAAIDKALELDNTLAYAYVILGSYRCFGEWDWENAEKAFQQALKLNPNLPGAHSVYSILLNFMGRTEEALSHIERALELDPLDPLLYGHYAGALRRHRRYDDAIAVYRTLLDMKVNQNLVLDNLSDALAAKGMHDEALAIIGKINADDAEFTKALEDGFKKAGYKGAYLARAHLLAERYGKPGRGARAQNIARNYLLAGEYELAIDWLEKAYEIHEPNLPYISGIGDPLRSNPRFQELLRKMNLPVDEKE